MKRDKCKAIAKQLLCLNYYELIIMTKNAFFEISHASQCFFIARVRRAYDIVRFFTNFPDLER